MQQIQRKIQQGQLSADAERLMTTEYRNNKVSQVKECIPDADRGRVPFSPSVLRMGRDGSHKDD
ncbi:hypothetical protein NQ318_019085 [Aromia moschata]|uniref:Uncharacterized protein n=1 Tax=Aromia moschata TaxID=1265417 RepID=A0AAV8Y773_9CUCU|nr:hypothetical protein NQ318_019085 [Aromia moschata]